MTFDFSAEFVVYFYMRIENPFSSPCVCGSLPLNLKNKKKKIIIISKLMGPFSGPCSRYSKYWALLFILITISFTTCFCNNFGPCVSFLLQYHPPVAFVIFFLSKIKNY